MRLPHRKFVDQFVERRVKRALLFVVLVTALPSIYLAVQLVEHEVFRSRARQFVRQEFSRQNVHVVDVRPEPRSRQVELTLIGARVPPGALAVIEQRLPAAGLRGAKLLVHQSEDSKIDLGTLKADIVGDIFRNTQQELRDKDELIAKLRQDLRQGDDWRRTASAVAAEFKAQYPDCGDVIVGLAASTDDQGERKDIPMLTAACKRALSPSDVKRAGAWLRARANSEDARVTVTASRARR